MLKPITYALALTAILGGCGAVRDTSLNPFNWFGKSREVPAQNVAAEEVNPLIPELSRRKARAKARAEFDASTPIATVTGLTIERIPGGAIIRAEGLDSYMTSFNAFLKPSNKDELAENGVLLYSFRRELPQTARTGGSEVSRTVTVARFVSDQTLQGVRSIRVEAAQNARETRRR